MASTSAAGRVSIAALTGATEEAIRVTETHHYKHTSPSSLSTTVSLTPRVQPCVPTKLWCTNPVPAQVRPSFSNIDHPVPQLRQTVNKGRSYKRHQCTFEGCGAVFTRKSNLKAHGRKHMRATDVGATPYVCEHCERRFKWRSSLKSHQGTCSYMILEEARAKQVAMSSVSSSLNFPASERNHEEQNFLSPLTPLSTTAVPVPNGMLSSLRLPPPPSAYVDSFPGSGSQSFPRQMY